MDDNKQNNPRRGNGTVPRGAGAGSGSPSFSDAYGELKNSRNTPPAPPAEDTSGLEYGAPASSAADSWDRWEAWATGKTDVMPERRPVIRQEAPKRQPQTAQPAVRRTTGASGAPKVVFEDERDAAQAHGQSYAFSGGTPNEGAAASVKKLRAAGGSRALNNVCVVLIVLTIVLFSASGVYLGMSYRNRDTGESGDLVYSGESVEAPKQNPLSYVPASPIAFTQTYTETFPEGMQEKFLDLYQQNNDLVGWLTVPETCIDFPVYQTDNNDYYLKHDNYDTYTKYGAIFLDSYCDYVALSKNTTLYGHHFKDNELIFAEIEHYDELDFYKARPVIEFDTLFRDYKWKVFAAFRTNGTDEGDNGYLFYYPAADMTDASFAQFYSEVMQRSYLKTSVDVTPADKILTLSTCTYFFDRNSEQNARFVLMARLVRDGESEAVDTSSASVTDSVRYPQLYYDVFGGTNPWANGSKWYPVQG